MKKDTTIIGAGLVGSLLSIYLAKRGHPVTLFERRGDMRTAQVEAGRSINLALSDRGLLALQKIGLQDAIREISIPMHGRFIHNKDGSNAFQPYGKEGQFINSVSRAELNKKLLNLAEQTGVQCKFDHKCEKIDWVNNTIEFSHKGDRELSQHDFQLLFGADGAYSAARLQHQVQHTLFDYQQHYIDCGYKELLIPAGKDGAFLLEKNALHIWPRKDYMLIALPNLDGSFTGTLFFPFRGDLSFEQLDSDQKVKTFFENTFPDLVPLVPDLVQQFSGNPMSSLVTVKCYPWKREGKFTLIGDAAHAIVPFFGQGMNAGFEDCRILDELIDRHTDDWTTILDEFQRSRKPDADAIADMAVTNFIEMRERTADPVFLLQKKIEARLHEKYPDQWIPAYSQVTFSPQIRYSEALQRGQRQEAIMQEIMQLPGITDNWQSSVVEEMILAKLAESEHKNG